MRDVVNVKVQQVVVHKVTQAQHRRLCCVLIHQEHLLDFGRENRDNFLKDRLSLLPGLVSPIIFHNIS